MTADWKSIDRWLMGEAFVESRILEHIGYLCDRLGPRWAGSDSERAAAEYVAESFRSASLENPRVEEFELKTARSDDVHLQIQGCDEWRPPARPCLFCPPADVTAPLVDVGYGMNRDLDRLRNLLPGSVSFIRSEYEPFSEPRLFTLRLRDLAERGVAAAITGCPQPGQRLTHLSAADWRDDAASVPLPLVQLTREDAARLQRMASSGVRISFKVSTCFETGISWNSYVDLPGPVLGDQGIVLGAHHDTTPDSPGANDNAAGVAVMLETARLLTQAAGSLGCAPGRTIRFVAFGAEEQGLQGSSAFVDRHYGPEPPPLFMMALDELCTGDFKGVVLQFPELRGLIQSQLDGLGEGLQCHVLTQLDSSGDMFPFARRGIPSSFLWRWRFVGKYPEATYGHSHADTPDKIRVRELKEYAGLMARFLLRLSHVPAADWPENRRDVSEIERRIEAERGAVFRTM